MAKGSSLWPRTRDRSASACDSRERPEEAPRAPASVSSSVRASLAEKPAGRPDRLQQQRHRGAGAEGKGCRDRSREGRRGDAQCD
jgi:hypothetical protein